MNKKIKKIYTIISNNRVIQADTGFSSFHKKVIAQEIGYNYSESHLRGILKEHPNYSIAKPETGVVYWLGVTKFD